MHFIKHFLITSILLFVFQETISQGTLPVYTDYLSDNIFMVHPSAAGIGYYTKLRMTHRQQWNGNANSPSLQTISMNGGLGLNSALGGLVFNDRNGYHSQVGFQGAYAYHLNFRNQEAANMLSFGLAASYVQNTFDMSNFTEFDPSFTPIVEASAYFNADLSFAYHNLDGYIYVTAKNVLLNARNTVNAEYNSVNLRRYLFNMGYFFGRGENLQFEPSAMFQYVEATNEKTLDINAKVFRTIGSTARLWVALSYRRSLDNNRIKELSLLSPIAGIEFNRFLISYTFTQQTQGLIQQDGGFHQLSLGINLFYKRKENRGYNPNYNYFLYKTDN